MEVRHCDYLPDIMRKAIRKHNELYDDNVTEVETDFYGIISIWINSFKAVLYGRMEELWNLQSIITYQI